MGFLCISCMYGEELIRRARSGVEVAGSRRPSNDPARDREGRATLFDLMLRKSLIGDLARRVWRLLVSRTSP